MPRLLLVISNDSLDRREWGKNGRGQLLSKMHAGTTIKILKEGLVFLENAGVCCFLLSCWLGETISDLQHKH